MFTVDFRFEENQTTIEFPCNEDFLSAKFDELGVEDKLKTSQYMVGTNYAALKRLVTDFADVDELNFLAKRLDGFDRNELNTFEAVCEARAPHSLMKYYLMIVLAVILLAGDFAVNKLYQKRYGTSLETGLKFNALMGLFTAIIFFAINGFKFEFSAFSMLMAGIVALSIMSYNILGFRVLKSGSMAFYTLFLMCGGMFVPYVWGVLFLREKLSILHIAGLILIISAIVLTANDKKLPGKRIIALCVAIFFLNGISSVAAKMHQIEKTYYCISETEFVIATGVAKFIIAAIAYMAVKIGKKDRTTDKHNKCGFAWGVFLIILSTLLSGLSYILQLNGAKNLPATVLYPLITGGTIIFSSVTGIIFFKEQISKRLILSIIICFAGTCMFL